MAKRPKTIITCAITGAIHTHTMSDALPYRAEDIAAQAVAAAEAGAVILHLHARRPEDGGVSIDPDHFAAFLPQVKQATPAVINISTGGSLKTSIEERIAPALRFSPEMCSLNMGSMNFSFHPLAGRHPDWKSDWEKDYVENSDTYIFRNTFRDIRNVAETLAPHGVKFEHECYDVGHLYNQKFCMDTGLFNAPIFIQFIFGILGGIGPEVDNPIFMKRSADRLFGSDYRWSVPVAGGRRWGWPPRRARWAATSASGWRTASSSAAASLPRATPSRLPRSAASSRTSAARSPPPTKPARSSA